MPVGATTRKGPSAAVASTNTSGHPPPPRKPRARKSVVIGASSNRNAAASSTTTASARFSSSNKEAPFDDDTNHNKKNSNTPLEEQDQPATGTASKTAATPQNLIHQVIPPDTSGAPSLSHFCSTFRNKRKRTKRDGNNKEEGQEDQPAPKQIGGTNKRNMQHDQEQLEQSAPQGPVVQIINGEIVLQHSSVVVGGAGPQQQQEEDMMEVVEEDEQLAVVGASYSSFLSRRAPQHWSVDETKRFYEALRQVGTDFNMMNSYFTHRSRKQLKRKYQVELIKNPHLIERALHPDSKKDIDLTVFQVSQEDLEEAQKSLLKTETSTSNSTSIVDAATPAETIEEDASMDALVRPSGQRQATLQNVVEESWHPQDDNDNENDDGNNKVLLFPEEEETKEQEADMSLFVDDPLLEEEQDDMVASRTSATPIAVALVPGAVGGAGANNKAKPKRPKFRSRPKKTK